MNILDRIGDVTSDVLDVADEIIEKIDPEEIDKKSGTQGIVEAIFKPIIPL